MAGHQAEPMEGRYRRTAKPRTSTTADSVAMSLNTRTTSENTSGPSIKEKQATPGDGLRILRGEVERAGAHYRAVEPWLEQMLRGEVERAEGQYTTSMEPWLERRWGLETVPRGAPRTVRSYRRMSLGEVRKADKGWTSKKCTTPLRGDPANVVIAGTSERL